MSSVDLLRKSKKAKADTYNEKNYRLQKKGLWIEAFLCLLTALAFFAAAYYAHVAHLQIGIMERQLEVDGRPWLSVKTSIVGPLRCNTPYEGCYLTVGLTFENIGHMPAVDVAYQISFLADEDPDHYRLLDDARSVYDRIRDLKPSLPFGDDLPIPRTIFPGERISVGHLIFLNQNEIDASTKFIAQGGSRPYITPVVLECFEYGSGLADDKRHRTGSIFNLFRTPPNVSLRHFAIDPLANTLIPAHELHLEARQTEAN